MEEMSYFKDPDAKPVLFTTTSKFKSISLSSPFTKKEPMPQDPSSDPHKPRTINYNDIKIAEEQITDGVVYTPCEKSEMSAALGIDIYFKMEFFQTTGSVKDRGARHALLMLEKEKKKRGAIAASLGNFAKAISYHGEKLGIPVTVVLPVVSPIMKIAQCRSYKANVLVQGKDMEESKLIALRMAKVNNFTYINSCDHPHVMAGEGTAGLEIMSQVPNADAVVIPVGGGGMLAGIALAIKTQNANITIIGVESDRCPSFSTSLQNDKPKAVPIKSTLADSLAVPLIGSNAFATARLFVDKMVVVEEKWIALAILRLIEAEKCVVEGAGAAPLAAILSGQLDEFKGKRVVLILSGGNIDTSILGRCLDRGMTADGRLVKLVVTLNDRPGAISELCKLIASIGVSLKDVKQERSYIEEDVFSAQVNCVCETRDKEHTQELVELLTKTYKMVEFMDTFALNKRNQPPQTKAYRIVVELNFLTLQFTDAHFFCEPGLK